jgi:hypothetical protein
VAATLGVIPAKENNVDLRRLELPEATHKKSWRIFSW